MTTSTKWGITREEVLAYAGIALLWLGLGLGAVCTRAAPFNETTQCPGGASPRSDIVACYNFDAVANCTTGFEAQCQTDNARPGGLTLDAARIIDSTTAAVGAGSLRDTTIWGSTGRSTSQAISGKEFALRYYQRFGPGAGEFSGSIDHGFYINTLNAQGCKSLNSVILDYSLFQNAINGSGCTNWTANFGIGAWNVGQWYALEWYGKIETSCSTLGSFTGCNGVLQLYKDGVLVYDRQNFNWCDRADPTTCVFASMLMPATYYNSGAAPWGYTKSFDAIVLGNDADLRIEPSANANATSPLFLDSTYRYGWSAGLGGFVSIPDGVAGCGTSWGCARHLGPPGDCAVRSGILAEGIGGSLPPSSGVSFDNTRNAFVYNFMGTGNCANGTDSSIKVEATGTTTDRWVTGTFGNAMPSNGSLAFMGYNAYAGASLWIDSSSALSDSPIMLGFRSQTTHCSGTYCEYIGLGVRNGRWAVKRSYTTAIPGNGFANDTRWYAWRGPKVLFNRWHNVEIGLLSTNQFVVWINGQKHGPFNALIASVVPNISGGQMFGFAGTATLVSLPVTLWVDNFYASTVSRQSCTMPGWQADCSQVSSQLRGNLPITGVRRPNPPTAVGN